MKTNNDEEHAVDAVVNKMVVLSDQISDLLSESGLEDSAKLAVLDGIAAAFALEDDDDKTVSVEAFLDDDIDIRDLDYIEVVIHHSLGDDIVDLFRDEDGTWSGHLGVSTLPDRVAHPEHYLDDDDINDDDDDDDQDDDDDEDSDIDEDGEFDGAAEAEPPVRTSDDKLN